MNGFTNTFDKDYDYHEFGSVKTVKLPVVSGSPISLTSGRKLVAESGSQFDQTESEIQTAVGSEQYFENKGGTFDVAALKSTTTEG